MTEDGFYYCMNGEGNTGNYSAGGYQYRPRRLSVSAPDSTKALRTVLTDSKNYNNGFIK